MLSLSATFQVCRPYRRTKPYAVAVSLLQPQKRLGSTSFDLFKNTSSKQIVYRNPSTAICYEQALAREKGTLITNSGALSALSGAKTGRSPSDKRIVDEANHSGNVWWGPVNTKLSPGSFEMNRKIALDFLKAKDQLYVVDGFAGWDPKYRLKIRVVTSRAYHSLFMTNMLIKPTAQELDNFGEPDFTIYNAGETKADPVTVPGVSSTTSVSLSFDRKEMVILGTEYAGEMKKGVFTVMHYLMPKRGVLSLHASANESMRSIRPDTTLFFGLSGTGKTTLSADPKRALIGDDEHCWSDTGVFNIEGGCYAKAIDLSSEKEPEIFSAIRYGSILENITFTTSPQVDREVDYSSKKITENTRACYPIEYIPNAQIPCLGSHPKNIILLTCDAFGVLPPVSRLSKDQAMYHFISGYTAKIAGTEVGVKEPQATFSACFGQPFLVWHPMKYAEMLKQKLEKHKTNVFLVNTGWTGGGYGVGQRIPLKYSRAIINAINSGKLGGGGDGGRSSSSYTKFPIFNLDIPSSGVDGVPLELLDPKKAWSSSSSTARGGESDFDKQVVKLAALFQQNFKQFSNGHQGATDLALRAGPKI